MRLQGLQKGRVLPVVLKSTILKVDQEPTGKVTASELRVQLGRLLRRAGFTKENEWRAEWGGETKTIKNLHIVSVDPEKGELEISGQIPGSPGSLVLVHKIKSGSLKELEHEVVAQIVEGEAPAGEGVEEAAEAAKPKTQEAGPEAPKENAENK